MASINDAVITGNNKTTGKPYTLLRVVGGKYEWTWGAQDCLRFLGAYRVLGPQGLATVISGHAAGQKYQATAGHDYTEYKGHSLLQLKAGKDDKRPMGFGAGKARGLGEFIGLYGMNAVVAQCQEIAGDAKPGDFSPKGKKKADSDSKPARKGGRKAADDNDSEGLDETPALSDGLKSQLLKLAEQMQTQATVKPEPAPAAVDSLDALEAERVRLCERLMQVNMAIRAAQAVAV